YSLFSSKYADAPPFLPSFPTRRSSDLISRTRSPSTSTRPRAIISSEARREATPACASTFCRRTGAPSRPADSVMGQSHLLVVGVGLVARVGLVVAALARGGHGASAPPHGDPRILRGIVAHLVDQVHIRQQRGDVGELVERREPQSFQKQLRGPIQDAPGLRVGT